MAKEICISSTPHETRLAILEDDQLAEIYYERENEYTLAGSIYNGRVTRVLPGMQSAFVDLGLERDAFLYITDFLELEDGEESEELEKAAASGANQAPREVRQQGARGGSPKPDSRQEPRPERGGQDRTGQERTAPVRLPAQSSSGPISPGQISIESLDSDSESEATAHETESGDRAADDSGDPGSRRWRGRRRRRGRTQGGPAGSSQERDSAGPEDEPQSAQESDEIPEIRAAAAPHAEPAGRPAAPGKFLLPGESLSKYGGVPQSSSKTQEAPAAPPKPASTYKPATLIEAPLAWDGSGLLPGESISRHRNRQSEPEVQLASEIPTPSADAPDAIEEEAFVEEVSEMPSHHSHEGYHKAEAPFETAHIDAESMYEEAEFPPPSAHSHQPEEEHHAPIRVSIDFVDPDAHEIPEPITTYEEEESAAPERSETEHSEGEHAADSEHDRSASHRVDPLPPSGFRLFGLGGKKKKDDDTPAETPQHSAPAIETPVTRTAPVSTPAPVSTAASTFAPGQGLVEEEMIEGEEYEVPVHHHKSEEHDLDDFEEETLQTRSGELGELLQEAHLDHRIQLDFDEKNGDEADDEDEDEEEIDEEAEEGAAPANAGSQPAPGDGSGTQRRDRNVRGRRGGRPGQSSQGPRGRGAARRNAQTSDLPIISDLLKPGQEILVQIAKEPIAKKGARITSHIALPGRFLVFMPTVGHVGVSRKIASDEERHRLKRILISERGEASGGFIVRTAAEGASEEELRADLRFLLHLWDEIKSRSESSKSPALIYHDLSLIERILRDQVSANFSSIWVDSEADYERIVRFLNRFSPTLVRRVKLYTKETPLFEHFGIQDEISKALRSKVWLKSGGSIVINQTEALVAIDINTGKYVGKSARLEDTIVKTNLDAVPEIVRQIRLRDLGGIIVIDFIDMDERKNRFRVLAALEEALKADRAPTKVLQFNDFGLVAITRKRVKQSLERTLSVPCPTCQATGMVKGPTTVCNEIYVELRKMKKHFENADVLLRVNPETVKVLKSNNASWLTEFEELVGKNILVKSDPTLHPEQFDIQG
jgi:Rne/Rng family ribonuclease